MPGWSVPSARLRSCNQFSSARAMSVTDPACSTRRSLSGGACVWAPQSASIEPPTMASLSLTPRGHLLFTVEENASALSAPLVHRLETAFGRGSGHGLFELGAGEVGTALPADVSYWRDFGARFVTAICTHPDLAADHTIIPAPAPDELEALVAAAPPMTGAEYLTPTVLEALWTETATAFRS